MGRLAMRGQTTYAIVWNRMELERSARVGAHQVQIFRHYSDVTTLASEGRERVAGLAEIWVDGASATNEQIEQLAESDLPGAREFRQILDELGDPRARP
jgi:hypothetical protein